MNERLGKYIESHVLDARVEQMWQGIEARRKEYDRFARRGRTLWWGTSLAVAAGILLGWVVFAPSPHPEKHRLAAAPGDAAIEKSLPTASRHDGAAVWTANEKMAIDLADGSRMTLSPQSRVALRETHSEDVELVLEHGKIACDVSKEKRLFSVRAGAVVVRVIGTKFAVTRTADGSEELVRVDVTEGIVDVEAPDGGHKRLAAGESWSVKDEGPAQAGTNFSPKTSSLPKGSSKEPALARARDLFAEAREKRIQGDAAGAARLYEQFLQQRTRDGRRGVAALELGRIKLDQLGDAAGAIRPLQIAAQSGAGGLGDDALARLAEAHARLGQTGACKSARARYLKSYPHGVHVDQIRALCP